MTAWLIPALKLVLPHVGTIFSAATPVFTKKKPDEAALIAKLKEGKGHMKIAATDAELKTLIEYVLSQK